jgi:hypothetical protein
MAKNTGEGSRKGSVKDRVQIKNPLTGTFVKLDTKGSHGNNRFVSMGTIVL